MPTKNLGPCACCVSRYPVKAVVTGVGSGQMQCDIVDGSMINVIIVKVSDLKYTVYFSDGTTSGFSYTSYYEGYADYKTETGGTFTGNNDPYWSFDRSEHTMIYGLPITATDASGSVYNATLALTWDADTFELYNSEAGTYISNLSLKTAANESFEFAFEKAEE